MDYYKKGIGQAFDALDSSPRGLATEQAAERLEKNGKNKLTEAKKDSLVKRFFAQLKDPMILILIVAAIVSGVTSVYSGEGFADVIIIMAVVLLNAILGVFQESKAEKAIEALQKMSAATSRVMRNGLINVVKSEDLVVGDVVLLEAGDAVPADGRIIENASLQIEESALTGESVPVYKTADPLGENDMPLGDRTNMVYMGSTVVYGRGQAIITATGMDTEMGKIADALTQAKQNKTPLQVKLAQLSKTLTFLVIGICVFIFAFGLLRAGSLSGELVLDSFMIAVSLAVAAIPEGLATVVTIVLSIGVTKMSKRNAIIRRLTAVETLGSTQVICSDKTGTLTQNKMTVVDHRADDESLLAKAMALCSDSSIDADGNVVGEPTENALVAYARDLGMPKPELEQLSPRIGEAPFDSMRKRMSTVHREQDGAIVQYTKGGLDEVLSCCTHYLRGGEALPLDDAARTRIHTENKEMADQALRVLAGAFKTYEAPPENYEAKTLERDLTFIGLVGMIDPIRPEVLDAVESCREAGIRTVMITGDHHDTAVAIAKQLGILSSPDGALTGAQLDTISDEELERDIQKYSVYARVQPEHKVRIVSAWRDSGFITAMTGDGVNDAPSLKNADIGIGMGITGTDVTKNVADMVLADDNFATIVGAVDEGRRIYDNVRKAIQFLLASNMSEVLSIFFATLLGFTILKPVHLLWINLITDTFPALALGVERPEADVMHRPPRDPKEGVFAGGVGFDIAYQGVLVTLLTLASYFIGHYIESGVWEIANSADGTTMAFLTLSLAEIFHSFNMRSQRGSIFKIKGQNKALWGAAIASFVLTAAVIYIPFLSRAFEFEAVSLLEFAVAVGLAATVIPIVELVKVIQRAVYRRKSRAGA